MTIDATERAELDQLRLATRLSGVYTWSYELGAGTLACARATFTGLDNALGYQHREMPSELGAAFDLLVVSEDRSRVLTELQAHLDGATDRYASEHRVRHKDGSVRRTLARGLAVRDGTGRPIRIAGTAFDVTGLKHVEEDTGAPVRDPGVLQDIQQLKLAQEDAQRANDQLRLAMEQVRLTAELSGITIWSYDLAEAGLDGATPMAGTTLAALGFDLDEVPTGWRERLAILILPEDQPRVRRAVQDCIDGKTPTLDVESRFRRKDGSVRWMLIRGVTTRDDHGRPLRLTGTSYDIQKRKEADEATRRAEDEARRAVQQLRLATDLSGVGVWGYELSPDGDLAKATSAFDRDGVMLSLGYEPDDVEATITARLGAVVYPEDQARMQVALQDVFTGTTSMFDEECRFVAKDGSLQWKLVRGLVTRDETGRPATFMGTAVNITQLKQVQEELQRVKERLELAVSGSKACTWDFEIIDGDLAHARVVFNNYWELLGYDGPPPGIDSLDSIIEYVVAPDDRASLATDLQAFLERNGDEWEREGRVMHRDGTERWQLSRGVVARDAAGTVTRFTGASIDITDRKLTEKALQESEDRFRRTFENAAVGMILTDLEGRFLEYNARFCEFLGHAREELAGRRFVELMLPDEVECDLDQQRRVVRGEIASFTRDKRYLRKDGAIVWGNITVSVIQRLTDGTPAHVMGILQDITERKALEVEIAKAQARMQLALRDSDVAVVEGVFPGGSMAESRWAFFNMWEALGLDPANVPTDFDRLSRLSIHPDDRDAVLGHFEAVVQRRSPDWYMEHRILHTDGSARWRLSRGTLLYDDAGVVSKLIATSTDITGLKEIERELSRAREAAESANRTKDDFLANVSHEIRTPMNAILGMTELALDSAPSEHQRQLLSTVRSAAKNLLTIINDLLDFSKIESGKLTLDRADFSLRAAVGDTLRALAVRAHRKGLELLCRVRPDVPDALEGDAGRLRQVLMNLVGNAIKFTPQGEVEVEVDVDLDLDAEPSSGSPVRLIFTVRDTGIGIARDKQAAIFRAFEQEDSSTTRKYGGTGLGLTISAQLASLMGGSITVQSAPGCGSTFRFTARFARSARPDSAGPRPRDLRACACSWSTTTRPTVGSSSSG